ncbi:sporulation membrane protein YtaF [Clostridium gasigenes]|uniref:Sporulation membrane protein YtaF n=1 Tax=Clostridium gasigenes TaxID=94869 RepID=A0A7X0VQ99_9CLOT|nr:sporulation membrane protein YtaF [Clostridium gasigenes]MBB6713778.1 sporulation membrane protein YtaF [Clostridium gasigenes]
MFASLLLVLSISLDSFVASIAYGTNKIKIPLKSALIIDIVSALVLGFSLAIGSIIKDFIPGNIAVIFSFTILLWLGIYRLFECIFKGYILKRSNSHKPLTFKLFDFKFVMEVYADEIKADFDNSKTLSPKEAFYLSLALSLDSLAVGFGSSLITINLIQVIFFCLITGIISILLGVFIGRKFVEKVNFNLSWFSGVLLIVLAFMRIL